MEMQGFFLQKNSGWCVTELTARPPQRTVEPHPDLVSQTDSVPFPAMLPEKECFDDAVKLDILFG